MAAGIIKTLGRKAQFLKTDFIAYGFLLAVSHNTGRFFFAHHRLLILGKGMATKNGKLFVLHRWLKKTTEYTFFAHWLYIFLSCVRNTVHFCIYYLIHSLLVSQKTAQRKNDYSILRDSWKNEAHLDRFSFNCQKTQKIDRWQNSCHFFSAMKKPMKHSKKSGAGLLPPR